MGFWRSRVAAAFFGGLVVWASVATGGCGQIMGIHILGDEPHESNAGGAGGAVGMGTASTGEGGGNTSSGVGGMGGVGGAEQCFSCTGPLWNQVLSGTEVQYVNDVAVDGQSNVVFVGAFEGSSDFNGDCPDSVAAFCPMISAGKDDVYVVKLDKNGTPVWMKRTGDSAASQYATDVAIDTMGDVIVVGTFLGNLDFGGGPLTNMSASLTDMFVAKLDTDGAHIWSKRFGGNSYDYLTDVAVDSSNNVLLVGNFAGVVDFGGGPMSAVTNGDGFIVKLDANGDHLWSKQFGNSFFTGVTTAPNDEVVVTGDCFETIDMGGGNVYCGPANNLLVAKFSSGGAHIWSKAFATDGNSEPSGVAVDDAGDILLTGRYTADLDFLSGMPPLKNMGEDDTFIAKLAGSTGNALWSRSFAAALAQGAESIVTDAKKNVFVTGYLKGSVPFAGTTLTSDGTMFVDAFLIEYDSEGNELCGILFSDDLPQIGTSLAVTPAGELILGVNMYGLVDPICSPGVLSTGSLDALVMKLNP